MADAYLLEDCAKATEETVRFVVRTVPSESFEMGWEAFATLRECSDETTVEEGKLASEEDHAKGDGDPHATPILGMIGKLKGAWTVYDDSVSPADRTDRDPGSEKG